MTKVKFTKFGANSAFGGFAPGDVLSCSEEMAQHLVESGVAVLQAPPAPKAEPEVQPNPEPQPEKPAKAAKGKK
jgi:hypothetical protein